MIDDHFSHGSPSPLLDCRFPLDIPFPFVPRTRDGDSKFVPFPGALGPRAPRYLAQNTPSELSVCSPSNGADAFGHCDSRLMWSQCRHYAVQWPLTSVVERRLVSSCRPTDSVVNMHLMTPPSNAMGSSEGTSYVRKMVS